MSMAHECILFVLNFMKFVMMMTKEFSLFFPFWPYIIFSRRGRYENKDQGEGRKYLIVTPS